MTDNGHKSGFICLRDCILGRHPLLAPELMTALGSDYGVVSCLVCSGRGDQQAAAWRWKFGNISIVGHGIQALVSFHIRNLDNRRRYAHEVTPCSVRAALKPNLFPPACGFSLSNAPLPVSSPSLPLFSILTIFLGGLCSASHCRCFRNDAEGSHNQTEWKRSQPKLVQLLSHYPPHCSCKQFEFRDQENEPRSGPRHVFTAQVETYQTHFRRTSFYVYQCCFPSSFTILFYCAIQKKTTGYLCVPEMFICSR